MSTDDMSTGPLPDDESLRRAAARLPDSVEPPHDLWPGIAAALTNPGEDAQPTPAPADVRRVRWLPALAAAASMGAVALVVLASLRSGLPPDGNQPVANAEPPPAQASLGPAFVQTRERLETSLDAKLAGMSPQTRRVVESNLQQIEQSLAAIHEALELEPGNASLHHLLMETGRQQLDLLQHFNQITGNLPEGVDMIKAASVVLMVLASAPALADQPISRRAGMAAGGELDVSNVAGSITVTGWDRAEVMLEGTLWDGAEELIFEADGDRTRIEVRLPQRSRNTRGSRLDIRVPENTDILATAVSADIGIRRISGDVRLQTVSGDVNSEVSSRNIEIRTVSGDIDLTAEGATDSVQIGVVSGDVLLRNPSGDLTVEAVSGDIDVLNADLERVNIEAVSGDIDLDVALRERGRLDTHTVSGDVLIRLSNSPDLEVLLESFSGDIRSLYGVDSARTSRYAPGRELRLEVGSGNTPLRVETLSGNITVRGDSGAGDDVRDLTTRRRSDRHDD